MQSTAKESARILDNAIRDLENFDTTVLVKTNGRIRHFRIGRFREAFAVWGRKMDNVPDLESGFASIAKQWNEGDLLIDSLTVQTSHLEYLKPEDAIYKLARSAWIAGLATYKTVETKAPSRAEAIVVAFTKELLDCDEFQTNLFVKINEELRELELTSTLSASADGPGVFGAASRHIDVYLRDCPHAFSGIRHYTADAAGAMAVVEYLLDSGELLLDTLVVKADKFKVKFKEPCFQQTLAFLCACAGIKIPDTAYGDEIDQVRANQVSQAINSYLTMGDKGIKIFNDLADPMRRTVSFLKSDFRGQKLNELILGSLNFTESDFSSCQLKKVQAERTILTDCEFEKADLRGSTFTHVNAAGANFAGADLQKCKFHNTDLSNARFAGANVAGADFKGSDLRGVDLTACNAAEAKGFSKAIYDDSTVLPQTNFEPLLKGFVWKGEGPDPYKLLLLQKQKKENVLQLDFSGFMDLINKDYDKARVSKSISMLKASRFELFCEQNSTGVVGIVRSQTDADLVYACKLGVEGTYACCTQNLNPCGGLRGALCKHILVLVIGLTKAGELETNEAAHRMIASKTQTPTLNKDVMAKVFWRYQTARSGEIDWRPTETIPEDYYAF